MRAHGLVVACVSVLLSGCYGSGSAAVSAPTTAAREVTVPKVALEYVQDAESAITAGEPPPVSGEGRVKRAHAPPREDRSRPPAGV